MLATVAHLREDPSLSCISKCRWIVDVTNATDEHRAHHSWRLHRTEAAAWPTRAACLLVAVSLHADAGDHLDGCRVQPDQTGPLLLFGCDSGVLWSA